MPVVASKHSRRNRLLTPPPRLLRPRHPLPRPQEVFEPKRLPGKPVGCKFLFNAGLLIIVRGWRGQRVRNRASPDDAAPTEEEVAATTPSAPDRRAQRD